jgi:hypothetical protein
VDVGQHLLKLDAVGNTFIIIAADGMKQKPEVALEQLLSLHAVRNHLTRAKIS